MQYNWTVKHLSTDRRGYATDGYFELEGVDDDGKKHVASIATSFGGDDLKPLSAWKQEDIDAYAETLRQSLEAQIESEIATLKGQP